MVRRLIVISLVDEVDQDGSLGPESFHAMPDARRDDYYGWPQRATDSLPDFAVGRRASAAIEKRNAYSASDAEEAIQGFGMGVPPRDSARVKRALKDLIDARVSGKPFGAKDFRQIAGGSGDGTNFGNRNPLD